MKNRYTAGLAVALGVMGPALGYAQSVPSGSAVADSADQLQEVVITAERRTENLQNVSIAATALQGSDLDNKAVTTIADLQYASPSLSIGNAGLTNAVNIRGIGLASGNPNVANGVATYVDGLFQPPIVSTNQFYDIADIEVLRGPQGTLVGSNSTGGAIFINSQNPILGKFGGYAEVGASNYDGQAAQAAVNLPVNDILAFRVAGDYDYHESYYTSIGPAYTNAGSLNEKSGRFSVLFKPGSFQALGKIEYTDRETGGYAATPVPGTQYAPFAPTDPFVLDYDTPSENHERGLISSLELRYEFADGITLRSLSGYQDKNIHNVEDSDGTAENTPSNPQVTYDQRVREREWTEEVNLLSPKSEAYDWVVGGYLQRNKIDVNIFEGGATGPGGPPLFIYVPQFKTTTGWFGQLNFHLAPQWKLETGVRYSTFVVDGDGFVALDLPTAACGHGLPPAAPFNGCQVGNTGGGESDGALSGKVALNYTPDDQNLLYGFVARGYKPGGFNSPTSNFSPETVLDFELGWKSTLAGGHLRTQLGGFYYNYHSFQFQEISLANGQSSIANLPTARIDGIEASLQMQAAGWGADAGLAYVDSSLPGSGSFVNAHLLPPGTSVGQCGEFGNPATPPGCFNYTPYLTTTSSGPNLYSPKWTLNGGLQYTATFGGDMTLTPRVNYAYVSGQFTSLTYSTVTDYLPAHGLLSALLTYRPARDWMIEGYGTNLTNKIYRTGEGLGNGNYYFYGAPRVYGVRARFEF